MGLDVEIEGKFKGKLYTKNNIKIIALRGTICSRSAIKYDYTNLLIRPFKFSHHVHANTWRLADS